MQKTLRLRFKNEEVVLNLPAVLGRAETKALAADKDCSRKHALIYLDKTGRPRLRDLESQNGTRLNGVEVRDSSLQTRDRILIGKTEIEIISEYAPVLPAEILVVHRWPDLRACIEASGEPSSSNKKDTQS